MPRGEWAHRQAFEREKKETAQAREVALLLLAEWIDPEALPEVTAWLRRQLGAPLEWLTVPEPDP